MAAQSEEFERAWAEIVADLTSDGPALFDVDRSDQALAVSDHAADGTADAPPPDGTEGASAASGGEANSDAESSGSAAASHGADAAGVAGDRAEPGVRTPEPASAPAADVPDPAAYLDRWEDEGHFTPPPPPELPAGSPATRLGWAGALGGIATLVLVTMTGWDVPRPVLWAAGLAALAGFVTLVWQLPDSREDGWDDGARL